MKHLVFLILFASSAWAQSPSYGIAAQSGAVINHAAATSTRPIKEAASAPATCTKGEKYWNTTSATDFACTATDTWSAVGSGGSMVYPGAGVAVSTGSAWGTSLTVGTAASNLVQLNGSAQLPAVSAALLTNFPTLNQSTTGNAATATALAANGADCSAGSFPLGVDASGAVESCKAVSGLLAGTATALATPRAIYGNNFDGSAALTQVIASTYGGTGNGFAKFAGPTTSEKTFTLPNASATLSYTIASGAKALATGAISSAACTSAQTDTATGTASTDVVMASFNGDPTAVTGYVPLTTGMLAIIAYPTADTVNFKVCNNTSASITPGAITINWRVVR